MKRSLHPAGRPLAAALTLAIASTLTACGAHDTPKGVASAPLPPLAVGVAEVQRAPLATHYLATATLRGRNTAVVTSKGMGYVRAIHVKAGDAVKAGQVLVELDTNDVQAGLMQAQAGASEAEAGLTQAERDVEAAKAARKLASVTYERTKRLVEQKAATPQQLDEAEMAATAAEARERMAEAGLARARARVGQAKAGVGVARVSLGDRTVVAPFDGRVVSKGVEVGNLASPGTPLLTVEEVGALRAEATVDESQTARISVGQGVSVEIESVGTVLQGQVGEIVPTVDAVSRAFLVKVDLPEPPAGAVLRPGMFARARFEVGQAERLVVPAAAVSPRGQLDRVFIVDGAKARLRLVTVGARHGELVEVLSGLDAGEKVVVAEPKAMAQLADARPISVSAAAGGAKP
jgi:multidrug efflux pump subunit AcrA (membrane-fusion protein)